VETIIEENSDLKVGINYPKTGYDVLDEKIDEYIKSSYHSSSSKSLSTLDEVNIDYSYFESESMISITLYKTFNYEKEIMTYNFDKENEKMISLEDFTSCQKLEFLIQEYLLNYYSDFIDVRLLDSVSTSLFSFDQNNLYLYYNPGFFSTYSEIIIVTIPLEKVGVTLTTANMAFVEVSSIKREIPVDSKVVALTFDDGPSQYTDSILEILKENDAVATFFILGNKVSMYQDVLKKAISYGNELGNHTYNHKWLTKLTDDEIKSQIHDTNSIMEEVLNYTPVLFRPSYGSLNKRVRQDIDLDIVLWNIDTMDWKYKNVGKIVSRATSNVEDLDIILLHDTYQTTKDSISKIISTLKEKGFTFVTVSELKEIKYLRSLE
jgi:peptidoglycan/xylan/chitin deacetylase (PgdA/CDA1 family)